MDGRRGLRGGRALPPVAAAGSAGSVPVTVHLPPRGAGRAPAQTLTARPATATSVQVRELLRQTLRSHHGSGGRS